MDDILVLGSINENVEFVYPKGTRSFIQSITSSHSKICFPLYRASMNAAKYKRRVNDTGMYIYETRAGSSTV